MTIPATLYVLMAFVMGSIGSLAGVALGGFFVYRAFRAEPLFQQRIHGDAYVADPFKEKDEAPLKPDPNFQHYPAPYPESPELYGDTSMGLPPIIKEVANLANSAIDKAMSGVRK